MRTGCLACKGGDVARHDAVVRVVTHFLQQAGIPAQNAINERTNNTFSIPPTSADWGAKSNELIPDIVCYPPHSKPLEIDVVGLTVECPSNAGKGATAALERAERNKKRKYECLEEAHGAIGDGAQEVLDTISGAAVRRRRSRGCAGHGGYEGAVGMCDCEWGEHYGLVVRAQMQSAVGGDGQQWQ
jgi:hypothetical protein